MDEGKYRIEMETRVYKPGNVLMVEQGTKFDDMDYEDIVDVEELYGELQASLTDMGKAKAEEKAEIKEKGKPEKPWKKRKKEHIAKGRKKRGVTEEE